ncbi:hypothetical protein ACFU5O_28310 [Streptomyces sp. NPDC057445]|uniref:hypothetical protein n=1 Tax=Streptomyces sp. NPDC057445 TaxID=3346136 RepID=UPI0036838D4D
MVASRGRGGKELARRKAALARAAGRMAQERQAAQRAEAERLRREARFDELAADFELAREDEEAVAAEVEEEVRRVRERGQVRIRAARLVGARVVVAMGEAGETAAGCSRRLGVGAERVKELRRLAREADAGADGGGDGGAAGGGKSGPGESGSGLVRDAGPGRVERGAAADAGPGRVERGEVSAAVGASVASVATPLPVPGGAVEWPGRPAG